MITVSPESGNDKGMCELAVDYSFDTIELKYNDIAEEITGDSMKVHRYLGNGFQEVICQKCLVIEFERLGLRFGREKKQQVYSETKTLVHAALNSLQNERMFRT